MVVRETLASWWAPCMRLNTRYLTNVAVYTDAVNSVRHLCPCHTHVVLMSSWDNQSNHSINTYLYMSTRIQCWIRGQSVERDVHPCGHLRSRRESDGIRCPLLSSVAVGMVSTSRRCWRVQTGAIAAVHHVSFVVRISLLLQPVSLDGRRDTSASHRFTSCFY